MKKFTIPCAFGGSTAPFAIYIGDPEPEHHPVHFQAEWLTKHRGGVIPSSIMDSIARLYKLAKKNNVSFEELCVYALKEFGDPSNQSGDGGGEGSSGSDAAAPPPPPPKK